MTGVRRTRGEAARGGWASRALPERDAGKPLPCSAYGATDLELRRREDKNLSAEEDRAGRFGRGRARCRHEARSPLAGWPPRCRLSASSWDVAHRLRRRVQLAGQSHALFAAVEDALPARHRLRHLRYGAEAEAARAGGRIGCKVETVTGIPIKAHLDQLRGRQSHG